MDISDTIKANSSQLNADDLLGGPITVQIERVVRMNGEQPVGVHITGGHAVWLPCLSMRRVLVSAWGSDAAKWHGRWVTLFRDPAVKWGEAKVGGIRIKAMSNIPRDMTLSLTVTRGKKKPYRVAVLRNASQQGAPTADLVAILDDAGLTFDDVDAWRVGHDKPALDTLDDDQQAAFGGWLAANPKRLGEIREAANSVGKKEVDDGNGGGKAPATSSTPDTTSPAPAKEEAKPATTKAPAKKPVAEPVDDDEDDDLP